MGKTYKKINCDGLTLIEVLAALVILGIVFIGIMSVFPQMSVFNGKTGSKLDTMNLARQEMSAFTENNIPYANGFPIGNDGLKLFIEDKLEILFPAETISEVEPLDDDFIDYKLDKEGTIYHYQILKIPDIGSGTLAEISLYRVILSVRSESNTPVSKTYGYLEIKN
ncbi:prepilin-type N-terminal cleavage/methylation domain-containing protein [Paenisporosarcina macmurdoensis]|uniref:Prepilin-type N-terminal cleavage/methylation domain-containing protein n=1 Tax=Paenisporosarcina macmurdoensis TaxID=212659 RepID=A0ABW1L915_9BACL